VSRNVLIVEDDEATVAALRETLEVAGHTVVIARDGVAALAALEAHELDLILLDLNVPVIDGWGFARGMRHRGRDVPIVVLSAAPDAGQIASEIGARGFLPKPFEAEQLLAAIS